MYSEDLFRNILLRPATKGCNNLLIVSGYATAAMAFHHMNNLKNIGTKVKVNLILGMTAKDGLSRSNHRGFQQLMTEEFKDMFECSYCVKMPQVHSKVYTWLTDDKPIVSFVGSANYTQTAFSNQRELMVASSPEEGKNYFDELCNETVYCNHIDAENLVTIYKDQRYKRLRRQKKLFEDKETSKEFVLDGLPHVRISLLDNSGALPARSGLNWGQRPEYNRESNQAYIRLPAKIYRTNFFPARKTHFTVLTDDDKVLISTRAQANGKAIESPHNNSLIGLYFRRRLGLKSGQFIEKADLVKYGRTHVDFYKIDNETYYMDFST